MSLIRQMWLLLAATLILAFASALGMAIWASRGALGDQASTHNAHVARVLARQISQIKGDPLAAAAVAIDEELRMDDYDLIRLVGDRGVAKITRTEEVPPSSAPRWFTESLGVEAQTGVASVAWASEPDARIEVRTQMASAQDALWRAVQWSLGLLLVLAVGVGAAASWALRRLREPLQATVEQAQAIAERRFIRSDEPAVPELRAVSRAMNAMVERLQTMFSEQATLIEGLRRQAYCDAVTGLSNRDHFLGRLKVLLGSEHGASSGGIVMVRLGDLLAYNRQHGRGHTDAMLQDAAAALQEAASRVGAIEVGRLNGTDFAMVVPELESLRDPAIDVAARLRSVLKGHDPAYGAVVGAVRWWHGVPASALLAAADHALARAEARGAFSVELVDGGDASAMGEQTWRERLQRAVAGRRAQLVEFEVVDVGLKVVHYECPLRLKFDDSAALVPAAQWLPMAKRAQLMPSIDLLAIELALEALAESRVPRAVNISPLSLADSTFVPRLRERLAAVPELAPWLWFELADSDISRQADRLRDFAHQAASFGARVGLEHVGERITDLRALLEVGLDFVKLDASLTDGVARDNARTEHLHTTVRVLHGIGVKVFAVGVTDLHDASTLWASGIDGLTGPVVPRLQTAKANADAL